MTVVCPFYTGRKAVFLWALLASAYEKRSNSSAEQRCVQIDHAAWPPRRQERTTKMPPYFFQPASLGRQFSALPAAKSRWLTITAEKNGNSPNSAAPVGVAAQLP